MRLVAVTIVILAGLATMPVAPAANECIDPCKTVVIPTTPARTGTTYYLYLQAAACAPSDGVCQGQPEPAFRGLLYEETNKCGGLQRYKTIECLEYKADTLVLL